MTNTLAHLDIFTGVKHIDTEIQQIHILDKHHTTQTVN